MTERPVPEGLTRPDTMVTLEGVAMKSSSMGSLRVDRVTAPGGWLYVTTHYSGPGYDVALHTTFVPAEPEPLVQEPVVNYEDSL